MKLWGGRFTGSTNELVEQFTASIMFDERLVEEDITGSLAHAKMLGNVGVLSGAETEILISGLTSLLEDAKAGSLTFSVEDEDIHMNVERLLRERIGPIAGKLHTARSRNDQVALDMHLYARKANKEMISAIRLVQQALLTLADENMDVIVPGFTHLQRAQPILFAHHCLAYFWMLTRDVLRLQDADKRMNMMPLGAGALAGTTFPIDAHQVADALGFDHIYENSLDAVSDRDYLLEFLGAASIVAMHLSRLAEEIILWSSEEFGWVELADAFCTGSSMMPQKKNPDVAELVRGKSGRIFGNLIGLLTVLKGLPLAYNKDLQEDKEFVFDTVDTLLPALQLFAGMLSTLRIKRERLANVFERDFSNATDVADYLSAKGMPFREAHEVVGKLVLLAIAKNTNLSQLPLAVYQEASDLFAEDIHQKISVDALLAARSNDGGTAPLAVRAQWLRAKQYYHSGG